MTLKEIFEKHGPYTRVYKKDNISFFTIFIIGPMKTRPNEFILEKQYDDGDFEIENEYGLKDEWEVYTEPKPKIKRWLWCYRTIGNYTPYEWNVTQVYFDEDTAKATLGGNIIKLEWSEQEFDE